MCTFQIYFLQTQVSFYHCLFRFHACKNVGLLLQVIADTSDESMQDMKGILTNSMVCYLTKLISTTITRRTVTVFRVVISAELITHLTEKTKA